MFSSLALLFSLCVTVSSSVSDDWHSKSQCTQKEFANHMDIHCQADQWILIGWSHYGTKKTNRNSSIAEQRCEPSENDCIMDYTHKIAELCNGVSKCEVILTQQFIHKCADEATYLFISYQCIHNSTILDVCSQRSLTATTTDVHLISPLFPNEYPNNVNCTCSIQSVSPAMIDVESLSFNLQDNDHLLSLSGTSPFGASLFTAKNQLTLTFDTDETLSQSGFWISFHGYHPCHDDELSLGSKCIQMISKKQTWQSAEEFCSARSSKLIHLQDIIQEKKLAQFLSIHQQQQQISFWISHSQDIHSWWPWRSSSEQGNCVLRTADGWMKRPCNEEHASICEREIKAVPIPLTIRCGQSTTTIGTTTTTTTMMKPSVRRSGVTPFVGPPREKILPSTPSSREKTRTSLIDQNILAAILGGVAIAIFAMNVVACYICRRRTQTPSKGKIANESQASLTHEELQRSLMQHLYHEQMNTISSTSTTSSSSKQSQAKSNETTTSNVHLLQLSSHSSQPYVRTTHGTMMSSADPMDYHVYETIPAENGTYTLCSVPSAFKPVLPSNTNTLRSHIPRTNVLYHPPRASYDISNTNAILIPACCYHQTFRPHVLPKAPEQIYAGSESIV